MNQGADAAGRTLSAIKWCCHYRALALCSNTWSEQLPVPKNQATHTLLTPGQPRYVRPKLQWNQGKKWISPLSLLTVNIASMFKQHFPFATSLKHSLGIYIHPNISTNPNRDTKDSIVYKLLWIALTWAFKQLYPPQHMLCHYVFL